MNIIANMNISAGKASLGPVIILKSCNSHNWYSGIANSFDPPITNGFIKGCNNKIKVRKRNAFGCKNFSRFRNRILHIFFA